MENTLQIISNSTGNNTELVNIKLSQGVGDFVVQFDVVDEQRQTEEPQSLQGLNGVNIDSHLDITQAILRQLVNSAQETAFLNILQHLLSIDSRDSIGDIIWKTAEKLVHRAKLIENLEESERLLRSTIAQTLTCPNCTGNNGNSASSSATSPTPDIPTKTEVSETPPAPAMPPPPPPMLAMPPPPLPPMPGMPPPPPAPGAPPAPPGCFPIGSTVRTASALLPHQDTPSPKTKMRTLNWVKIPPQKILGKQNVWTLMANNQQQCIDYHEFEQLFCIQSTKRDVRNGSDTVDSKWKKTSSTVHLIDSKRSLNINIFLKQFKGFDSNDAIVQLIQSGNHKLIGLERLKGLLNLLPEEEEIKTLKNYDGDRRCLGSAESFLLMLMQIQNYKLRIESMVLKEEFAANITYLEPCIYAMIDAGNDLINSKTLLDILYFVMVAGNFLNCGGYAGNAAGVNLSCLTKLTDIRANKPGMNLMHFVTTQIEKFNPALLQFTDDLKFLENVSKINIEQISSDIKGMDMQLQKIKAQIEQTNIDEEIREQTMEFLMTAGEKLNELKKAMEQVDSIRLKVADFFCEDAPKFRLDECFKTFHLFCENFSQSLKENEKRQQLERSTLMRQKQREEQKSKSGNSSNSPVIRSKRPRLQHSDPPSRTSRCIRIEVSSTSSERNSHTEVHDELINCLKLSSRKDKPRKRNTRFRIASQTRSDLTNNQDGYERERCIISTSSEEGDSMAAIESLPTNQPSVEPRTNDKPPRPGFHRHHSVHYEMELQTLPEGKCMESKSDTILRSKRKHANMMSRSTSLIEDCLNVSQMQPRSSIVEVIETEKSTDNTNSNNTELNSSGQLEGVKNNNSGCAETNGVDDVLNSESMKHDTVIRRPRQHNLQRLDLSACNGSKDSPLPLGPLTCPVADSGDGKIKRKPISLKTVAKLVKFGRRLSSINQDDLQDALKNLKTPTIVPDCIWDVHKQRLNSMIERNLEASNVNVTASSQTEKPHNVLLREHPHQMPPNDMDDDVFENLAKFRMSSTPLVKDYSQEDLTISNNTNKTNITPKVTIAALDEEKFRRLPPPATDSVLPDHKKYLSGNENRPQSLADCLSVENINLVSHQEIDLSSKTTQSTAAMEVSGKELPNNMNVFRFPASIIVDNSKHNDHPCHTFDGTFGQEIKSPNRMFDEVMDKLQPILVSDAEGSTKMSAPPQELSEKEPAKQSELHSDILILKSQDSKMDYPQNANHKEPVCVDIINDIYENSLAFGDLASKSPRTQFTLPEEEVSQRKPLDMVDKRGEDDINDISENSLAFEDLASKSPPTQFTLPKEEVSQKKLLDMVNKRGDDLASKSQPTQFTLPKEEVSQKKLLDMVNKRGEDLASKSPPTQFTLSEQEVSQTKLLDMANNGREAHAQAIISNTDKSDSTYNITSGTADCRQEETVEETPSQDYKSCISKPRDDNHETTQNLPTDVSSAKHYQQESRVSQENLIPKEPLCPIANVTTTEEITATFDDIFGQLKELTLQIDTETMAMHAAEVSDSGNYASQSTTADINNKIFQKYTTSPITDSQEQKSVMPIQQQIYSADNRNSTKHNLIAFCGSPLENKVLTDKTALPDNSNQNRVTDRNFKNRCSTEYEIVKKQAPSHITVPLSTRNTGNSEPTEEQNLGRPMKPSTNYTKQIGQVSNKCPTVPHAAPSKAIPQPTKSPKAATEKTTTATGRFTGKWFSSKSKIDTKTKLQSIAVLPMTVETPPTSTGKISTLKKFSKNLAQKLRTGKTKTSSPTCDASISATNKPKSTKLPVIDNSSLSSSNRLPSATSSTKSGTSISAPLKPKGRESSSSSSYKFLPRHSSLPSTTSTKSSTNCGNNNQSSSTFVVSSPRVSINSSTLRASFTKSKLPTTTSADNNSGKITPNQSSLHNKRPSLPGLFKNSPSTNSVIARRSYSASTCSSSGSSCIRASSVQTQASKVSDTSVSKKPGKNAR